MMDVSQILQLLQALHQKNNQGASSSPLAQMQSTQAPADSPQKPGGQFSMLGFLGGLGDGSTNGNVDPSLLTQMNQGILGQMPWQQTASQGAGQAISGFLRNLF